MEKEVEDKEEQWRGKSEVKWGGNVLKMMR